MSDERTTAVVQRYLDQLAGDGPAEPVVRALLDRAVRRLHQLCAAVLYRENRPGVFVVDSARKVHFRRIAILANTGDRVAATGLTAGERVVVEGAGFLGEGDLVRVGLAPAPQSPSMPAR